MMFAQFFSNEARWTRGCVWTTTRARRPRQQPGRTSHGTAVATERQRCRGMQTLQKTPRQTRNAMSHSVRSDNTNDIGTLLVGLRRELLSHASRLAGNTSQAEDIVQETLLRALRFEDHFEKGTNLRAWTHQILINVARGNGRRHQRECKALQALSNDPCSWTTTASNDQPNELQTGLCPSTQRAIDRVPQPYRATLLHIDVEGLSYRDAATHLGIPIGTVMSRLNRGRKLLAKTLRSCIHETKQAA